MTPPYEMIDNNLPIYNAAHEEGSHAHHSKMQKPPLGQVTVSFLNKWVRFQSPEAMPK